MIIINYCVGFNAPIDFNPGALTHLLATSQLIVQRTLAMFSHQYMLPTHVHAETSEARQAMENDLKSAVLPQLDVTLMALSPMERNFGEFCYINNSEAIVPQVTGSLSPSTP